MHRLYVSALPYYIRNLNILGFLLINARQLLSMDQNCPGIQTHLSCLEWKMNEQQIMMYSQCKSILLFQVELGRNLRQEWALHWHWRRRDGPVHIISCRRRNCRWHWTIWNVSLGKFMQKGPQCVCFWVACSIRLYFRMIFLNSFVIQVYHQFTSISCWSPLLKLSELYLKSLFLCV